MVKAKKQNPKKTNPVAKPDSTLGNQVNKNGAALAKSKKRSFTAVNDINSDQQEEYEDLGQLDSWDWNEVTTPSNMFMGDESTGFLCLEEISDVEVDYEGDDRTGKVLTFKVRTK